MPPQERRPPRSASRRKRERRRELAIRSAATGGSRRLWLWNSIGAGVVVVVLIAIVLLTRGSGAGPPIPSPSPTAAPTATPTLLATTSAAASGATVDGIQCQPDEQVVYHIHAHLAVFVNGSARTVPQGIGIPPPNATTNTDAGPFVTGQNCYYWLHTHTDDGIIHIESPTQATYTLANFFSIWGQPLSSTQVGPATGTQFVFVNGQPYSGNPAAITLTAHELIQIDVGTDVPPQPFTFPPGL